MEEPKGQRFDSCILAGGYGKRLLPLTRELPKPMLPVAGKSLFSRTVTLLRANGFAHTAVTAMYLPEKLRAGDIGTGLEFFTEEKPLGSAGAVARLRGHTDGVLLVISGDAYCDFDLAAAKKEFMASNCKAAMLLCRREDVSEYGSVCLQGGLVTGFCEKPSLRDTLSDLVNTGIYFLAPEALALIPDGKEYDFGRDLFPAMLKQGIPICGIEPEGNWFDIGSFAEYHACNMLISGGKNCIGERASVHPGAVLEKCVVFDGATIGESVVCGSIIGSGVTIGNGCHVAPGCVIGDRAELESGAVIGGGRIVAPGEHIKAASGARLFPKPKFVLAEYEDFIMADETDSGYFVTLGRRLARFGSVAAFARGEADTLPRAFELACGAAERGVDTTVISGGSAADAAFAAYGFGFDCTAHITRNGSRTEVRLYSGDGMPLPRERLRMLTREDTDPVSPGIGSISMLPHGVLVKRYLSELREKYALPGRMRISGAAGMLHELCEELSVKNEGDIEFSVSDCGERVCAKNAGGEEISYWQLLAACCSLVGQREIFLPSDSPVIAEKMLAREGMSVRFYGDGESEERRLAAADIPVRNGALLAIALCGAAEKAGKSVSELVSALPPVSVFLRELDGAGICIPAVIARLRAASGGSERCVGYDFGEGRVNVFPGAAGRFRLIAEAADSETAEEISLRAVDLLKKEIY